jgi:hypothetical protein
MFTVDVCELKRTRVDTTKRKSLVNQEILTSTLDGGDILTALLPSHWLGSWSSPTTVLDLVMCIDITTEILYLSHLLFPLQIEYRKLFLLAKNYTKNHKISRVFNNECPTISFPANTIIIS